jgi:hypothetical protein
MLTITLLLLALGALLAAFGTAGYRIVGASPDTDSLRAARAIATGGRRLAGGAITLYALHPTALPHPNLWLAAATIASAATLTTRRPPGRHRRTTTGSARGMTRLPHAAAATGVNR